MGARIFVFFVMGAIFGGSALIIGIGFTGALEAEAAFTAELPAPASGFLAEDTTDRLGGDFAAGFLTMGAGAFLAAGFLAGAAFFAGLAAFLAGAFGRDGGFLGKEASRKWFNYGILSYWP